MTGGQVPGVASAWRALPWRTIAVVALLAAAIIAWAALPLSGISGVGPAVLGAAIATGVLSLAQLVFAGIERQDDPIASLPDKLANALLSGVNVAPWAELMTIAVAVLEAMHAARPWHTGVLGIALLAFLFAVHLAETGAAPRVLRPQLRMLAAGVGLLALAVGAAALPAVSPGAGASAIRVIAIVAAVAAGAATFPLLVGRRR